MAVSSNLVPASVAAASGLAATMAACPLVGCRALPDPGSCRDVPAERLPSGLLGPAYLVDEPT